MCRARESGVPLYIAGWRVNLLLASSPAALQIDPPTDDRELPLRIARKKESLRRELNQNESQLKQNCGHSGDLFSLGWHSLAHSVMLLDEHKIFFTHTFSLPVLGNDRKATMSFWPTGPAMVVAIQFVPSNSTVVTV